MSNGDEIRAQDEFASIETEISAASNELDGARPVALVQDPFDVIQKLMHLECRSRYGMPLLIE